MSNKFPYFKHLHSNLVERKNQVMRADRGLFAIELNNFLGFLKINSITKSILDELEAMIKNEDLSEYHLGGRKAGEGYFPEVPDDESLQVAFYYRKLKDIASLGKDQVYKYLRKTYFSDETGQPQDWGLPAFKENVFLAFYRHVLEKAGNGDFLLYLLYRFKLLAEWFERDMLFEIYDKDKSEDELDKHLRKFLFQEGIDYPYSKPSIPSGEPDLVLHVEERPLPLEIKVFDPSRKYNKARIIGGFNQANRYVEDYNTHLGYLVVFNASDSYLKIESSNRPPSLKVGSNEIFVIVVDINPDRPSASRERHPSIEIISQDDLK